MPRFHIPWGTGTGVVAPFEQRLREHVAAGRVFYRPRHRVDQIVRTGGVVTGVRGVAARRRRLAARGREQPRRHRRVRVRRPGGRRHVGRHRRQPRAGAGQLARSPRHAAGRPAHRCAGLRRRPDAGDHRGGRAARSSTATGCGTTSRACATGTRSGRATRSASCPARAPCGSTAPGNRLPAPFLPGFDTLGTLDHLRHTGFDHSWFVLNRSLVGKEFALSGSEQNLDLTERRYRDVLTPADHQGDAVGAGLPRPRGGLGHRRHHRRARREDERPHPRRPARRRPPRAADRRARPAGRQRLHQGHPGRRDPGRAALPRRPAHQARLPAAPHPRPEARAARRGAAAGALAQDARRAAHRPRRVACSGRRASRCRGSTPRARSPGSAAVACTGTAPSRGPSSGAACSRGGRRAGLPRRTCERGRPVTGIRRSCHGTGRAAATAPRLPALLDRAARSRSPAPSSRRSRCRCSSTG